MMGTQQGDVKLYQTDDNGEIRVEGGVVDMDGGLSTSVYLSLFGGEPDDSSDQNTDKSWWGNLLETNPSFQYRSRTQHVLESLPLTLPNLLVLKEAVLEDCQYLLDEKIASDVHVEITVPTLNKVKISINVEAVGQEEQFEFVVNWQTST